MVTILYESFAIADIQIAPDGSLIIQIVETDDDGHPTGRKHVFPLAHDSAKQFHKVLGEKLGQKITPANMQDMKRETRRAVRDVPQA